MAVDQDRVEAALSAWFGEGDWRSRNVRYRELMSQALAARDALALPPVPEDVRLVERLTRERDEARAEVEALRRSEDEWASKTEVAQSYADTLIGAKNRLQARAETAEARLARAREALKALEYPGWHSITLARRALADTDPADQEYERVGGRMAVGRDWRPIDTAPKDGTMVLLSCSGGPALACWSHEECGPGVSGYAQCAGWFAASSGKILLDEGWDTGAGYRLEVPNPTHWMPIPEPPTCEPAGRAALAAEGE
jgi:hypothetical protein